LVNTKWDEIESDDEDEPVEMCPTTSTTSTDHRASTLKQEEDQKGEDVVPLQGPVRPVTPTGQTGASRGTPICLMAKKEKKSKKKRQAKGAKDQKIEASSSPTRELELLKSELSSLVCKYESLANKYDHDIKSFACRAKIEEEANDDLEAKLTKLTSEHMALQADHKGLECSYEKLIDSYATLEIAHEVVFSSVKSIQPLSHTCTCSQVQVNLSCANDCLSQASQSSIEHVLVESCDDLIAKENDQLKQEVEKLQKNLYVLKEKIKVQPSQDNREDMVKKLEKGSTVTSSSPKQHTMNHKNKIQKKSKVGQAKSQYRSIKNKAQESLSKKPRSSKKWRVCYKCREKGHFADTYPNATMGSGTDRDRSDRCMPLVRPVPAKVAPLQENKARKAPSPRTRLISKHGKEIVRNDMTNKNKNRICYECRLKGHMGKDCQKGNIPKSNLVHYDFHKLRNDKNGTCAMREISSHHCSMRAIWIPKHLVTNPIGPNKYWVPINAC
jgi:hypothetical protein